MSCSLLFTEDFSEGIGGYSLLAGTGGIWTLGTGGPYGDDIQHANGSIATSIVQKSSVGAGSTNRFDLKFQVTSTGSFGSGFIQMFDSGVNGPIIIPRDNTSNDTLQRTGINPGSGIVYFTTPATIGDWYQVSLVYSTVSGASTATLTDLTAGGTQTISFSGVLAPRSIDNIRFNNPNATNVAGVMFSDIELYNCSETGTASFTVDTDTPIIFDIVTFTDTSTPSGAISWSWDFGDGNSSTLENPTHAYDSAGEFDVVLETTWDFGTFSSPPTIITVSLPSHQVSFTADPTSGPTNTSVTFTDISTPSGAISWAWDFGDGGSSTEESPVYLYTTVGDFDVILTVTWDFGTFSSDPITISIHTPIITILDDEKTLFLPIKKVVDEEFAAIRMRGITNAYPTKILDNGGYPNRQLLFWPVPSDATKAVELWLWEPLQIYDLDQEIDLPPGYERYYVYALLLELADIFSKQVTQENIDSFQEAESMIKTLNQIDFEVEPSNAALELARGGRTYNIIDFLTGANMLPRSDAGR